MKVNIQSTKKEYRGHAELLLLRHLQPRHSPHRQPQNDPIKHNIRYLHAYEEVQVVDASPRNFRVPSFPNGCALESPKKVIDEEPYEDEDSEEYDRAPERRGGEDATVEEEDRELDGCDGGTVELGGDVNCLSYFLQKD